MRLLQPKQSEETKRLREQMEAEAKAQRDQMDNMMKASMKQAEEDRRAFMQENQALNQRLVEMQKSNERMQQMIFESVVLYLFNGFDSCHCLLCIRGL